MRKQNDKYKQNTRKQMAKVKLSISHVSKHGWFRLLHKNERFSNCFKNI